ncbi:MAG: TlpA family protein disulfide reductase [Bernardetiaceae bacterium]|nr:TlpA family protein disulfide reductase [Bernardetiaceae bacterium]
MSRSLFSRYALWLALLGVAKVGLAQLPPTVLPTPGAWRGQIALQGQIVPFNFEVETTNGQPKWVLLNAGERLVLDEVVAQNDSLKVLAHIFEAEVLVKVSPGGLAGYWIKSVAGREVYRLPFSAQPGPRHRFFPPSGAAAAQVNGHYDVVFSSGEGKTTQAVGVFEQRNDLVTGTFLTATGDYRYLEGQLRGDSLFLSAFTGESAYLFRARVAGEQINGEFWSGKTGHSTWTARRNPAAQLPDADKLTYLKPGFDRLAFSLPDLDGQVVSLADPRFKGKVVIVQILGSWCPNCMDETGFLAPFYQKNKEKGLEIVGLAYERSPQLAEAKPRIEKMKQRLGVAYPVLFAGSNDKAAASASLPMLNQVLAFPTTIIIDRAGRVRRIHTGFAGPGTGKYYLEWVEEFDRLVAKLLKERG